MDALNFQAEPAEAVQRVFRLRTRLSGLVLNGGQPAFQPRQQLQDAVRRHGAYSPFFFRPFFAVAVSSTGGASAGLSFERVGFTLASCEVEPSSAANARQFVPRADARA